MIIADLGFRVGYRKLVAACVHTQRPVQQLKLPLNALRNRLQASRAFQFKAGRQPPAQPDVFYDLVLAMMLFYDFGASRGLEGGTLLGLATEVDDARLKLLLKFKRTNL